MDILKEKLVEWFFSISRFSMSTNFNFRVNKMVKIRENREILVLGFSIIEFSEKSNIHIIAIRSYRGFTKAESSKICHEFRFFFALRLELSA